MCTTTNGTFRSAAAVKPSAIAEALVGEPSTPTTTGNEAASAALISRPRTTTTGQAACAASPTAVDPTINSSNRPNPRSPMTTIRASRDSSDSTST